MSSDRSVGRHAAPDEPGDVATDDTATDDTATDDTATETAPADDSAGTEAPVVDNRPVHPPPTIGDRIRTVIRGLGQTSITLGVVILLFVVYELWFTDYINAGKQRDATNKLEKAWNSGDDPLVGGPGSLGDKVRSIPLGTGIAIIRIPRLGLDYARTVVEGTNADDLDIGPGHYTNSALPGQKGNLAIAGHRVGKGSPFLDLDKLKPGDAIVLETKSDWYTYRVLGNPADGSFTQDTFEGIPGREIVDPSDVKVVAPVPDHVGQTPTRAMITLTTCHPKFSATQRMIIHGMLQGKPRPKSAGLPSALRAGS
jgi:sortase A